MDKYAILSITTIILIILLISLEYSPTDEKSDDTHIGLIYDIKETDKGMVFFLEDTNGKSMKCFLDEKTVFDDGLKILKGGYSADGKIFFVENISNYC